MSNKMKLQIGQLERQITDEKSKCDELKQFLICIGSSGEVALQFSSGMQLELQLAYPVHGQLRAISQKHGGSEIEALMM